MRSKIGIVVSNNIWLCPYINIYTKFLDECDVSYDIISWCRDGKKEGGFQYFRPEKSRSPLSVLWSFLNYAKFVKKTITENKYDKLIIFSVPVGIFLSSFFSKQYKGRYVCDYRDLSIDQKKIFNIPFKRLLKNSYLNVVSSPGFIQYLPQGINYIVSHNFNYSIAKSAIGEETRPYDEKDIRILTIGAIRKDCNTEVMDALSEKSDILISFVGKGPSAGYLEEYARTHNYSNVKFSGYYKKSEEEEIYKIHTFVNIVYPLIPSHISALSNRFYNSLIYKRPMIVTRNTIQGDYAERYKVGLIIDNCKDLYHELKEYLVKMNFNEYSKNCNELLRKFLEEQDAFNNQIKQFINI